MYIAYLIVKNYFYLDKLVYSISSLSTLPLSRSCFVVDDACVSLKTGAQFACTACRFSQYPAVFSNDTIYRLGTMKIELLLGNPVRVLWIKKMQDFKHWSG
ncbi:MAG: hypothetical protein ABL860_03120, partial [Candidatus Nitrotoga sp.]